MQEQDNAEIWSNFKTGLFNHTLPTRQTKKTVENYNFQSLLTAKEVVFSELVILFPFSWNLVKD